MLMVFLCDCLNKWYSKFTISVNAFILLNESNVKCMVVRSILC